MTKLSDNVQGAVFMMLGMAGFVFNDTLMKLMSSDLPMFQAIFLRGFGATLLISLMAYRRGALWYPLQGADWRMVILRITGEVGATVCFITALFNMPIANATAILQVMPLAVTLGAALFLRETVGWRRYTAIGIGFIGVLIMVRPGSEGFSIYSTYAMATVLFLVLRDLATRKLAAAVPSLFVTFLSATAVTLHAGVMTMFDEWAPVAPQHVGMLAGASIFILAGYLFSTMAMRVGDVSFSSPFRYTVLLWAILSGIVVFGEIPDMMTIFGSLIVVLTGLYTFYREHALAGGAEHNRPARTTLSPQRTEYQMKAVQEQRDHDHAAEDSLRNDVPVMAPDGETGRHGENGDGRHQYLG